MRLRSGRIVSTNKNSNSTRSTSLRSMSNNSNDNGDIHTVGLQVSSVVTTTPITSMLNVTTTMNALNATNLMPTSNATISAPISNVMGITSIPIYVNTNVISSSRLESIPRFSNMITMGAGTSCQGGHMCNNNNNGIPLN